MKRTSTSRRGLLEWLVVSSLLAAFVYSASIQGWFERVDLALYDQSFALGSRPPPADVAIVTIDDRSLARIGRWPWSRKIHTALLERLTTAKVAAIATDLILTEQESPESDRLLASAIAAQGRVIVPVSHEVGQDGTLQEVLPVAPIAEAAAGFGHIRRHTDADGQVRRAELWVPSQGWLRPHMALALLGLTDEQRYRAQIASDESFLIPYAGPPGHYRHYAYSDVLEGKVPDEELRGKVIFVGATATGLSDNFPTPVSQSAFDMPGIEICATLYDALRSGIRIVQVGAGKAAVASAASVVLLLALLRVSSPLFGLLAAIGHALGWLLVTLLLLKAGGIWLPPAAAIAGTALAYPYWSWRRLAAAQAYMEQEIEKLGREPGLDGSTAARAHVFPDSFTRSIENVQLAVSRLQSARRFIQEVVDGLPVGILVADSQFAVRLTNAYAEGLFGGPAVEPGQPLVEILEQLTWPPGTDPRQSLLRSGLETAIEAETANNRHLLVTIGPFNQHGRLVTLADITSLRQAQVARDLALRFLSHDLRSPLVSILALLGEEPPEGISRRIATHANVALTMANDFTQLAKAESLDIRNFTETDLVVVIEDALDDVWVSAQQKGIALVRDIAGDEALLQGDRATLRRALSNLLENAVRYSPSGTQIVVRLAGTAEGWNLGVIDQGYGIAADDLPKIFLPYTRLNPPGQAVVPGTGLGLAMVKAGIERHGGKVTVESEPGNGTAFHIFLPRNAPEAC